MVDSARIEEQLSDAEATAVVEGLMSGDLRADLLRDGRSDSAVYRVRDRAGRSLVVKVWRRSGWTAAVRRLTRTSPARREARNLAAARAGGVNVPSVLGLARTRGRWTDALLLQDLGPCVPAIQYLKTLLSECRGAEVEVFLSGVIDLTGAMLRAGVVDADHSFSNIVATADGKPCRLDLEVAEQFDPARIPPRAQGVMLGRVIFAVILVAQPDVTLAMTFAGEMRNRLGLPRHIVDEAQRHIDELLDEQARDTGIVTRFNCVQAVMG